MNSLKATRTKTKIIWSFEPKSLEKHFDTIVNASLNNEKELASFDVLRMMYDPDQRDALTSFLKLYRKKVGDFSSLPLMLDFSIKSRATVFGLSQPQEVAFGDKIKFKFHEEISKDLSTNQVFHVHCSNAKSVFKKDAKIYLGYGNVLLQTLSISADEIEAEVMQGGTVFPYMEVHVPSTRPAPSLDQIDIEALTEILGYGIDYVVLPGFVSIEPITKIIKTLESNSKTTPWFLIKLDSTDVFENLDELIESVQGVLVSRLDLALTMNPVTVPLCTKRVIEICHQHAKISIIASEILGSMRHFPTPTRAEISDIANAVSDGADAVVLSEDIPFGDHSQMALKLGKATILDLERSGVSSHRNWLRKIPTVGNEMDAVAYSAYRTAIRVGAKAIVCLTEKGNTALKLASFRPNIPIIAVCFHKETPQKLTLVHGVEALHLELNPVLDDVLPAVNNLLISRSWLKKGDKIVFVSVTLSSLSLESSNIFTIQTLESK